MARVLGAWGRRARCPLHCRDLGPRCKDRLPLVRAAADDVDTYDICLLVPYNIRICCFEVHE